MTRVLVVDDEPNLTSGIRKGLEAEGFAVDVSHDGKDALWLVTVNEYDVVVLDMMLPGLTGTQIVERMRQRGLPTPVLMLTAVSEDEQQARALDLGADDYLTKPFNFVVLLARLRALLRRTAPEPASELMCGSLMVDPIGHRVTRRGEEINLTPREFQLLEYLVRRSGAVVSKRELLDEVWEGDTESPANVVEVYVGYLRRKVDAPFATSSLTTVRGYGYRFDPQE